MSSPLTALSLLLSSFPRKRESRAAKSTPAGKHKPGSAIDVGPAGPASGRITQSEPVSCRLFLLFHPVEIRRQQLLNRKHASADGCRCPRDYTATTAFGSPPPKPPHQGGGLFSRAPSPSRGRAGVGVIGHRFFTSGADTSVPPMLWTPSRPCGARIRAREAKRDQDQPIGIPRYQVRKAAGSSTRQGDLSNWHGQGIRWA